MHLISSSNCCNSWIFQSTLPQFMYFIRRKVKLTTTGWKTLQWHSNHEEITTISAVWDRNIVETQLPSQAENANLMREKYEILRIQQIHLIHSYRTEVANGWCKWQSGGGRRMAVTSHFVSEPECGQGQLAAETPTYPILIPSSWRVTKKIALEWVEVKFPRF